MLCFKNLKLEEVGGMRGREDMQFPWKLNAILWQQEASEIMVLKGEILFIC